MRLKSIKNKALVIWGAGKEGISALRWLRRFYPEKILTVLTDTEIDPVTQSELQIFAPLVFESGTATAETLKRADVVIKSPGISLYRNEVAAAKQVNTLFTSTANLWLAEILPQKIIAVTGTKGKSTTSAMIHHALEKMRVATALGGNIGTPLLDLWDKKNQVDIWVVEFSSYQTADLNFHPTIGVLLNLYPEHIDWHQSLDNYFHDKLNLFKPGEDHQTILNSNDSQTMQMTAKWPNLTFFGSKEGIHFKARYLYDGTQNLGQVKNPDLAGDHNLSNVCAALTAIKIAGFDPADALSALSDFKGLPHRQQILGTRNRVTYVDDSISTTPETALAAVDRFDEGPITLILGGYDRKQDYKNFAARLCQKNVHTVITIPDNGPRISRALHDANLQNKSGPKIVETENMAAAVAAARRLTRTGGIVILSPAAPSYGRYVNYIERGKLFAKEAGFDV
jgi:UDP-N-acetylmuramoyl-L-alanine---L-glutamate ligase